MRISSGQLKGRAVSSRKAFLRSGPGDDLRPTSSKVREALFDILRNDLEGSVFLDLYAGTGTVGLEALSRGASKTYFVESNVVRSRIILESIGKLDLHDRADISRKEACEFLKKASLSGMVFDIVFADPPYSSDELEKILPLLSGSDVLRKGGILICEHPSRKILHFESATLHFRKQYRYGDTMLTLYRRAQ